MDPRQEEEVFCTINLRHARNGRIIRARIAKPVSVTKQPPGLPEPVRDWGAGVTVEVDGTINARTVWSMNWICAFTLALDYVCQFIPEGEERDWIDEEGLESWCIFPKTVPIGWGHDLYQKISRMVDDAERVFEDDVQFRRLAAEKRRDEERK